MAIFKSAVLAWKYPTINSIICEGDNIIKWDVAAHPQIPTEEELITWKQEYELQVVAKSKEEADLTTLGGILKRLAVSTQTELINSLMSKAAIEGII